MPFQKGNTFRFQRGHHSKTEFKNGHHTKTEFKKGNIPMCPFKKGNVPPAPIKKGQHTSPETEFKKVTNRGIKI